MKMVQAQVPSKFRTILSKKSKLLALAIAPVAAVLWAQPTAVALTWDSSGLNPTAPVDGPGTWDNSLPRWTDGTNELAWDSTSAVFGNSATLGTAGTVTLGAPISAAALTFNASTGDYTIIGAGNTLTLTGTPVITVAAGQSPTISAPLAGTAGFTFNGPGAINFTADNSALSGNVTINSGTVNVAATSNLGASTAYVNLGTPIANVVGNLSLAANANVSIGSFAVATNTNGLTSGNVNTLSIGTGATLNVSGTSIVAGSPNATVNAAFVVGTPNGSAIVQTNLTLNGGGSLVVGGPTNASSFLVGLGNTNTSADVETVSVDMTGLTNFSFQTGTGAIPAGGGNEFAVGHGGGDTATLSLAANSTIIAGTITVADNNITPGLTGTIPAPNAGSNPSTLNLGSGTNILDTNNLIIGNLRPQGIVQWTSTVTTGTVTIAGAAGGSSTANITVGNLGAGTPPSSQSQLNLKGHSATVQANTVIIGELSGATGGKATTSAGGNVTFDTGTFNAVNIKMGFNSSGTSLDNITGTLNVGSSANSTGVFNVTGSFLLDDNINTANTASLGTGVFNMKGGTANIGTNIIDASITGNATQTASVVLTGGTLNMQGFAIGPITTNPNGGSTRHVIVTLPTSTATIANLGGTGINDAGLTMNGTGTLILTGTNTYGGNATTSATTISSGTLQVGAATDTSAPTAPFLSGTGTIADNATLAFGSSQNITVLGPINGSGNINQNGTGTTILAVNNGYLGGTTVSKGILQVGNGGATGNISAGTVTDNATLAFNRSDPVLAVNNLITGSGAVAQNGPGILVISNAANTYSGGTIVNAGTVQAAGSSALGFGGLVAHSASGTTVNTNANLDLNGLSLIQQVTLSGGTLTNSSSTAATIANGIQATGVTSSTGPFTGDAAVSFVGGGGTGASAIAVLGLSGNSFTIPSGSGGSGYTGNATVTIAGGGGTGATGTAVVVSGVVTSINITNPGTGYTSAPTITIAPPTTGTTATAVGNAANFVLDGIQQTATGTGYTSAPIASITATTGTAVLTTPLVGGIVLSSSTNSFIGGTGNIAVTGPVSGGGSLTKNTTNTVTLQAPNTYNGNTSINAGTLVVDSTSSLASNNISVASIGTLTVNNGGSLSPATNLTNNGTVNFNNPTRTIATLNSTTGGAINLNTTVLTVTTGGTYVGTIGDAGTGGGVIVPVGSVLSTGSINANSLEVDGKQAFANTTIRTLSKVNTLTVAGSLGAWTGSLDLTSSRVIVEDASLNRASDLAAYKDMVANNLAGTVGIFSSTAAANGQVVVVSDNAVRLASFGAAGSNFGTGIANVDASSILLTAAVPGDANLDGVVDIKDLQDLANHWQQPATDWSQADFDGNGVVALQDLQALANHWQNGVGAPGQGSGETFSEALSLVGQFGGTSSVPEPMSLAILGCGGVMLMRRRKQV